MAKTSIPSMGSPITSVDVTYDGKWVVATSDHYLMVVKTSYQNDKGATCNAFTSRMGGRGSMPRLLRLKPEDQARVGNKPLQKGKFSWITESGQNERWIVASCGEMSSTYLRVCLCFLHGDQEKLCYFIQFLGEISNGDAYEKFCVLQCRQVFSYLELFQSER
jgi:hypothetical protein